MTTHTFLFTDIEASTAQWETSEVMNDLVEQHFEVLRSTVAGHGGTVFASMGDGIGAAFTSVSHAALAALDAQEQLEFTGLKVRMGLHTGEAHRVGSDFRGRTLNRAARVAGAGHGGQVLCSGVTADLLRSGPEPLELIDLGLHRLRDLAGPEHLWQLDRVGRRISFAAPRSLDTYANNLPLPRSSFIGRERELDRVVEAVRRHRVVTLTGVGGVGKTRLAIHAAAEALAHFPGVWFVDLTSAEDAEDVVSAIAVAAGMGPWTGPPGPGLVEPLCRGFASQTVLLVLDNCEHLVDEVAEVTDQLTACCESVHVLATSREPLAIDGEQITPIKPLTPNGEAVELFIQRAEAGGLELSSADRPVLTHICERLDGLPLAIELAASRAPALGLAAIVEALDDRFSLLAGGRRRAIERHQTMRATVEWSYRLLEVDEQLVFERMSVFIGGFELDTAKWIAQRQGLAPEAVTELIESLVRKCMLEVEVFDTGARYRMLQTVRDFAREHLARAGEEAAAQRDAAEWVATLTDTPYGDFGRPEAERVAIRLEREAENWRLALVVARRFSDRGLAARLCGAPTGYFLLGRHDLTDDLEPLVALCSEGMARRNVLTCHAIASAAVAGPCRLTAWAAEIDGLDSLGDEPRTGAAHLVRWLAQGWGGRNTGAGADCLAAADDERLSVDTRNLFLGLAMVDRYGDDTRRSRSAELIARAEQVVATSEVAAHRAICRLGIAWMIVDDDPDRARAQAAIALGEVPHVPRYLRRTLPGNAARLLVAVDPLSAAADLQLRLRDITPADSMLTLIPAVYAAYLLRQVGHPLAGPTFATLTQSSVSYYFTWTGWADVAVDAARGHEPMAIDSLFRALVVALDPVELAPYVEQAGVVSLSR